MRGTTIGALAGAVGVSVGTVRFYERRGQVVDRIVGARSARVLREALNDHLDQAR